MCESVDIGGDIPPLIGAGTGAAIGMPPWWCDMLKHRRCMPTRFPRVSLLRDRVAGVLPTHYPRVVLHPSRSSKGKANLPATEDERRPMAEEPLPPKTAAQIYNEQRAKTRYDLVVPFLYAPLAPLSACSCHTPALTHEKRCAAPQAVLFALYSVLTVLVVSSQFALASAITLPCATLCSVRCRWSHGASFVFALLID